MFARQFFILFVLLIVKKFAICQAVRISDYCSVDEDCDGYDETTECDPILHICLCNSNYILFRENPESPITCEPINLGLGEPCKLKEQCTRGVPGPLSDCLQNTNTTDPTKPKTCHCIQEAVYDPREHDCHLKRNFIGDDCKVDVQCQVSLGELSHCLDTNECACTLESVQNKNETLCLPIINYIGIKCEERQQCTEGRPGNYSDCIDAEDDPTIKVCSCINGSNTEPEKHECLKSGMVIGEACQSDGDCVKNPGIFSGCSETGTCLCLGGYLRSNITGNCLKIRNELGDSCVESQQCQHGIPGILSACIAGECGCTGFSVNEPGGHYCHRKATLVGDPCQIHEQCWGNLGKKSYCVGGRCECNSVSQALDDLSKCF